MADQQNSPPRHDSDPELVQACLRGDEQAWAELVERYSRLIYSVARRHGLSPEDSDDVVQVVFTIALRRLEALKDTKRLSSWLITTAYRECWRIMRATPRHQDLADRPMLADTAPLLETELIAWEEAHLVRLALSKIDSRCRDLLSALFLDPEPPSYEALARRLGMSIGSIGPTRARCFRKLETELSALGLHASTGSNATSATP
ncbi:MAG: sigma-70 family RNA polymerase sigma factor [Chloroflexia bacterium]|nr:sigma-70 family RNA polymerase sigma factor [Chloroflexia bacterium]